MSKDIDEVELLLSERSVWAGRCSNLKACVTCVASSKAGARSNLRAGNVPALPFSSDTLALLH
eukprot:scaffold281355_cov14-Tisochrysis_lutea.AAC.1